MTRPWQIFQIYKCTSSPNNSEVGTFRILETNMTSDGLRTRIVDGVFKTAEEAELERQAREERSNG